MLTDHRLKAILKYSTVELIKVLVRLESTKRQIVSNDSTCTLACIQKILYNYCRIIAVWLWAKVNVIFYCYVSGGTIVIADFNP